LKIKEPELLNFFPTNLKV